MIEGLEIERVKFDTRGYSVKEKEFVGHYFDVSVKKESIEEKILLKDWTTGQTFSVHLGLDDDMHWVVVGFYEKMKQLYKGKNLVAYTEKSRFEPVSFDSLYSIETGESYKPSHLSTWTCVDMQVNTDYKERSYDKTRVALILQNGFGEHYYCFLKSKMRHTPKALIAGLFYTEEYSNEIEEKKEQLEAERKEREEQSKKEQSEALAQRRANLEKKYKKSDVDLMLKHKFLIGWTKQMCIEALGKPDKINKTSSIYGNSEQWVYGSTYLYFDNGKLTTAQNHN